MFRIRNSRPNTLAKNTNLTPVAATAICTNPSNKLQLQPIEAARNVNRPPTRGSALKKQNTRQVGLVGSGAQGRVQDKQRKSKAANSVIAGRVLIPKSKLQIKSKGNNVAHKINAQQISVKVDNQTDLKEKKLFQQLEGAQIFDIASKQQQNKIEEPAGKVLQQQQRIKTQIGVANQSLPKTQPILNKSPNHQIVKNAEQIQSRQQAAKKVQQQLQAQRQKQAQQQIQRVLERRKKRLQQRQQQQLSKKQSQMQERSEEEPLAGMMYSGDPLVHFEFGDRIMDMQVAKILRTNFSYFPSGRRIQEVKAELARYESSYQLIRHDPQNERLKEGIKNYRVMLLNQIGELIMADQGAGFRHQGFQLIESQHQPINQDVNATRGVDRRQQLKISQQIRCSEPIQCAICLQSIPAGQLCVEFECKHTFHIECSQQWVQSTASCPCCRRNLKL